MIYVKIFETWYDFTNFKDHPGSYEVLKAYHLKDATNAYLKVIIFERIKNEYKIKNEKLIKELEGDCSIM
jgi:cytochrome b involved in lipid metabolism